MQDIFKTLGNAFRPCDFQTNDLSGAEEFEKGSAEREDSDFDKDPDECDKDSEADDCNCSDPWCSCGGRKKGY